MAFDLELTIRSWRGGLSHWRAFSKEDLDELEGHLRDHTASLVRNGKDEQEAYAMALAKIGNLGEMEKAYKEVSWRKIRHKRLLLATVLDHLSMFRGYAILAIRGLTRHRGYSALNISGLTLGLTCSFFVLLWMQTEVSVDQFHENADRLFQVKINDVSPAGIKTWQNAPLPMAEALETEYPEVENAVLTLPVTVALSREGKASREKGYYASRGFFEAFSFPLLAGEAATALDNPSGIVISEQLAVKHFGSDWQVDGRVLGQNLTMSFWQSDGGVLGQALTSNDGKDFVITGVFRKIPQESTLRFDVVLPVREVVRGFPHVSQWGPRWFDLTLMLRAGSDVDAFESKISSTLADRAGAENQTLFLQPFARTYLHGSYKQGEPSGGRIQQVYLIGLVGLAILLMACVNFANLVTARAGQRAKEIGVRKAVGAAPSHLVQQFLSEAVMTTLVAFVFAAGFASMLLPAFNAVTGLAVEVSDLSARSWTAFLGVALLTGCFAGSYPAFYLASLNPVRVLRSQSVVRRKGEVGLRKGLVMFQFAVSALLIVGTLTVYQQLRFLQTTDLGIDKDNVVRVLLDGDMANQFEAVEGSLLQVPGIEAVSRSSEDPVSVAIKSSNLFWGGKTEDDNLLFTVLRTDDQFAGALKLTVSAGRFFERDRDLGQQRFVVNEAAVRAMALKSPIGHPFAFGFDLEPGGPGMGQIVGVVKDFHTGSLIDEEIGPVVFRLQPEAARFMLVRVATGQTSRALAALEAIQATLNPGYLFEYAFLDETYQAHYEDQAILGRLSQVFAFLALFISCMGLLGLSAFSVQQRTKEIGVRRVLGATKTQVLFTLSRDFMTIVGLSLLVALPVAFWGMTQWLSTFAYRIDLGPGTVAIAAILSLALALGAVGYQAMRAIRLGPARSLRSE
jgi:putative ABC transport system permease protein